MNGARPVTSAELDAHLIPMRHDIQALERRFEEFGEFMTGAIASRTIQERIIKSRHFWIGAAIAMFSGLVAALGLIVHLSSAH